MIVSQNNPRVQEWQLERDRLVAKLAANDDGTGWPLSPEAKDNLRNDIAECDRTIRRIERTGR